jgi:hypothetical protein
VGLASRVVGSPVTESHELTLLRETDLFQIITKLFFLQTKLNKHNSKKMIGNFEYVRIWKAHVVRS